MNGDPLGGTEIYAVERQPSLIIFQWDAVMSGRPWKLDGILPSLEIHDNDKSVSPNPKEPPSCKVCKQQIIFLFSFEF